VRASVLFFSILVAASASLAAPAAHAQHAAHGEESEFPVSFVERPLTLPRFTLAPFGEFDVTRLGTTTTAAGGGLSSDVVLVGIQLGASFGITDNIEVGAVLLPIQFNNGAGYGGYFLGEEGALAQPSVFATFRFFHQQPIEIGARLLVQFLVPRSGLGAGALIEPSLPLLVHIGKIGRFDAEVGVPIRVVGGTTVGTVTTGTTAEVGLDVPLRLAFDIIEPLHIGLNTGLVIEDFGHAADTTAIPLGIFMGYAVGQKKPLVDIDPFFSWFQFLTPGATADPLIPGSGDKVRPGHFVVGVNARGYIYF
jgi:hypothetical protein